MASGMINLIKQVAMDAMENNQMTDLRFGTVVSTDPLKVRVTNQFTIPEELLIVPEHLTDYEKEVSFDWYSETDGGNHSHSYIDTNATAAVTNTTIQTNATKHRHQIKSDEDKPTKKIKIHCALKKNEKVALLRKQGGQCYYILDRV